MDNFNKEQLELLDNYFLFPLSARNENALSQLAAIYAEYIAEKQDHLPLEQIIYTAASQSQHHPHRAVVMAQTKQQLVQQLLRLSGGQTVSSIISKVVKQHHEKGIVYVFNGLGPQWWGMGHALYQHSKVFKETAHAVDEIYQSFAGWSILEEMLKDEQSHQVHQHAIAQPANFLLQVALCELLKHYGIVPSAVVGHSAGEMVGAYVCGALDLEQATMLSYHRSRLLQKQTSKGEMIAVALSEDEAHGLLTEYDKVSICAMSTLRLISLSGDEAQIEAIAERLIATGIEVKHLKMRMAYHSPYMDEIQDELLDSLASISPQKNKIPMYSTVYARPVSGEELTAEYWWKNVRQPVNFLGAVRQLYQDDYKHFLHVGPYALFARPMIDLAHQSKVSGIHNIETLNRNVPELEAFMKSIAELHCLKSNQINWSRFFGNYNVRLELPEFPWIKEIL